VRTFGSSEEAIPSTRLDDDLNGMAAAPALVVDGSPLASPELALVDADLAAELRKSLHSFEDSSPRAGASFAEAPRTIEEDTPIRQVPHERWDEQVVGHLRAPAYSAELVEQIPTPTTTSSYPVLPALETEETGIEATQAALKRIRDRLTDESRADSGSSFSIRR
jgi:hypothetical protein